MEKESTVENEQPLVKNFEKNDMKLVFTPKIIAVLLVVVVVGILSGYMLSGGAKTQYSTSSNTIANLSTAPKGTVIGSNDTKTYSDSAEGVVREGGIEGEGAFHLERPGGDSQNVYLTSANVDLTVFVGKKIKVWGQTQDAKHAGWLMDVGRIEVL
jgi:hypothetical protein